MATRTIRLNEDDERRLEEICRSTGLTISGAVRRSLRALEEQLGRVAMPTPYDLYSELDLGPGGYAKAPSTSTREAAKQAIERKLRR